jgi:release factor glutamine methyltransferase
MSSPAKHLSAQTARLAAAGVPEARLKAELALARVLGIPRLEIGLRGPAVLSQPQSDAFLELTERLLRHEPWQHITGETDFLGHVIRCSPAALIPRPETEQLALLASERLAARGPGAVAADIGTGTGCIAIHLALANPQARVIAVDISPAALDLARDNARRLGAAVDFFEGDLTVPLRSPVHVLVSNPPYIGEVERERLEPQVGLREPALALFGGRHGHELPVRLLAEARGILAPGGNILLEIGASQGMVMLRHLQELGYEHAQIVNDFRGLPRIATAVWNGSHP